MPVNHVISRDRAGEIAGFLASQYGLEKVGHDKFKYGEMAVWYYWCTEFNDGDHLVIFMVEGYGRAGGKEQSGAKTNLGLLLALEIGKKYSKCLWRLGEYLVGNGGSLDWNKAETRNNNAGHVTGSGWGGAYAARKHI